MVFAFLGTQTIIVILVVALLVFGPHKLPEIGRQLGAALRELSKMREDVRRAIDLEQFTNLDMPHYDAPYGTTYATNGTSELESYDTHGSPEDHLNGTHDGRETSDTHQSDSTILAGQASLIAPPGPPSRLSLVEVTGDSMVAALPAEEAATLVTATDIHTPSVTAVRS